MRKKENERIERENHAFAKRLFDREPVVKKTMFDFDYQRHLQYKRQIQRISFTAGKPGTSSSGVRYGMKRNLPYKNVTQQNSEGRFSKPSQHLLDQDGEVLHDDSMRASPPGQESAMRYQANQPDASAMSGTQPPENQIQTNEAPQAEPEG